VTPSQVGLSLSSSPELLYFALGISLLVIVLLAGLTWRLMGERIKGREREMDLLDRRLQTGTDTMQALSRSVTILQGESAKWIASMVSQDVFVRYISDNQKEHRELERMHSDLVSEVRSMGAKLDGRLSTITTLLSKLIVVKDPDEEKSTNGQA